MYYEMLSFIKANGEITKNDILTKFIVFGALDANKTISSLIIDGLVIENGSFVELYGKGIEYLAEHEKNEMRWRDSIISDRVVIILAALSAIASVVSALAAVGLLPIA